MDNRSINVNIDGNIQKVKLENNMNLNDVKNDKVKQALSIFDSSGDGILQEEEINKGMRSSFNSGTFSVSDNM